MAVLSVKELFCRRECVFLQSVSAFLQLIVDADSFRHENKIVLCFSYVFQKLICFQICLAI